MATTNRTQENRAQNFKQIEGDSWVSSYLPAICAGTIMAVVLLLAISCSKKNDRTAAKVSAPSAPSTTSPIAPAPAAVAPVVAKQAAKKIKKHRPSSATYVNGVYGVSFSYPRKFSLQTSNDQSSSGNPASVLKPGSVEIVRLDMPTDSYPDTDFSAGLLEVSVNPSVTAEECQTFESKSDQPAKPTSVKLGSNDFAEMEQISAQGQAESDRKLFHVFKNQACYEFALDVETSRHADEELAQVDRGKVFEQLEKILRSAQIKSIDLLGQKNGEKNATPEMTETKAPMENAQVTSTEQK